VRDPFRLRRDLGWVGFLGFQALFLGAAGAFLSQPVLWSAWIWWALAGGPGWLIWSLHLGQAVMLAAALSALRRAGRPELRGCALTLPLYWPLGTVAAVKDLIETALAPTWWDKTGHGSHPEQAENVPHRNARTVRKKETGPELDSVADRSSLQAP